MRTQTNFMNLAVYLNKSIITNIFGLLPLMCNCESGSIK